MNVRNTTLSLMTLAAALCAAAATAAGNHAGEHGHDDAAIGQPGLAANVTRTIQVDMSDKMRYTPASMAVKQGETIRFVVRNRGRLRHEFVLGQERELKEHYEVMKKFPEMEHAEPNMVSVAPGGTGEVIWQFTKAGPVHFACLHPGHYDAGMKGRITVASTRSKTKSGDDGHAHKH